MAKRPLRGSGSWNRRQERGKPRGMDPPAIQAPNLFTPQRLNLQSAEKGICFLCVSEIRVSAVQKICGLKTPARKQQIQILQRKGSLVRTQSAERREDGLDFNLRLDDGDGPQEARLAQPFDIRSKRRRFCSGAFSASHARYSAYFCRPAGVSAKPPACCRHAIGRNHVARSFGRRSHRKLDQGPSPRRSTVVMPVRTGLR